MLTERKGNTTVISTHSKNYETVAIILEIRYCFLLKLCLWFDESNLKTNIFLQFTLVTSFSCLRALILTSM